MSHKDFILEKEDGVAILTLNRPDKLNAMNLEIRLGIQSTANEINMDDNTKVLIIIGAGNAFCSGADVGDQLSRIDGKKREQTRNLLLSPLGFWGLALARVRKPTIAAVNGIAAGGGLSLALLCDIRIAGENARFSAVWVRRGLVPDVGASYFLPRILGTSKALELIYTGAVIDAKEAERIGLVSRVVPQADLMSVAKELALKIAKGPSVAIELAKLAVLRHLIRDLEDQLYFESYSQKMCYGTQDHVEGVRSFFEKRPPAFKGL